MQGKKREARRLTGMRIRLSLLCPDVKLWGTIVRSRHAVLHDSIFDYSGDRRHRRRAAFLRAAATCYVEHAIINHKRMLGPFLQPFWSPSGPFSRYPPMW